MPILGLKSPWTVLGRFFTLILSYTIKFSDFHFPLDIFIPNGLCNTPFSPQIKDVFKEEAAIPDGDNALLNPEEEWPSDDPEDDDYYPERKEDNHSIKAEGTDDNASNDLSSSSSLGSLNGECSPVDEGTGLEYYSVNCCIDSDDSGEIACGRRQRKSVDYKKLYDVSIKFLFIISICSPTKFDNLSSNTEFTSQ